MRQSILEFDRRLLGKNSTEYPEPKVAPAGWLVYLRKTGPADCQMARFYHQQLATFTCNEQLHEHKVGWRP